MRLSALTLNPTPGTEASLPRLISLSLHSGANRTVVLGCLCDRVDRALFMTHRESSSNEICARGRMVLPVRLFPAAPLTAVADPVKRISPAWVLAPAPSGQGHTSPLKRTHPFRETIHSLIIRGFDDLLSVTCTKATYPPFTHHSDTVHLSRSSLSFQSLVRLDGTLHFPGRSFSPCVRHNERYTPVGHIWKPFTHDVRHLARG